MCFIYKKKFNLLHRYFRRSGLENFLAQATGQFRLLQSLCQLAEQTLSSALDEFGAHEFITSQILPATLFDNQIRSIIRQFVLETPNRFFNTLQLVRRTIHGNSFMTVYTSNWM